MQELYRYEYCKNEEQTALREKFREKDFGLLTATIGWTKKSQQLNMA